MYAWRKLVCQGLLCNILGLKSLIKDETSYKNSENPSSIYLILTNNPRSFQNSCVIQTGLSDFHRMAVTAMKTSFKRLKPRVINYKSINLLKTNYFEKNYYLNYQIQL